MEKVLVRQLFRQTPADGAQLLVSGWVRTVRDSKAFAFIELNDGSFFKNLQIVLTKPCVSVCILIGAKQDLFVKTKISNRTDRSTTDSLNLMRPRLPSV